MGRLLARYLLLGAAVVLLNFALPRFLPGDPLAQGGNGLSAAATTLTQAQEAQFRAEYHLDQPLGGQFASYLRGLARGDLGWSISQNAAVSQLIGERLPWTLALVLTAVLVAGVGGVLLGLLAAWRGGRTDMLVVSLCSGLTALPEFLIAMLLLLLLSVGLGWFPLQGGRTAFATGSGGAGTLADILWHLTLPALTLVVVTSAAFVLVTRGAVQAVLHEPYLVTARAKGLPEMRVAFRHAAPNALLPVLTLFGLRLGQVLGGAVVVERVFAVPGLGLLAYQALNARDYPVLQAVFLLGSLAVLLANLILELLYRHLEPRRGA